MSDSASAEFLYAACNGHVIAIHPATGKEIWRTSLRSGWSSATACEDVCLLADGGQVFAGCMGHLFALDAATGVILWHNELPALGYNDVTLAMAGKSVQVISRRK